MAGQTFSSLISESWEKLTLADDFFFGYSLQNLDIAKDFLEILLSKKIERISHLHIQDSIKLSPNTRGIRLDVKLFGDNRIINIEMQTTNKKDLPKRIRYYQATIDSKILKPNTDYNNIPELINIFICTFDYFGKGLPLYTVRNTIKELGETQFDDSRRILIYNTKGYEKAFSDELKDLLNFITGGIPKTKAVKQFAAKVQTVKDTGRQTEEYMDWYIREEERRLEAEKEGMEKGMKEGARQNALKNARNLLKENVPEEIISRCTGISVEALKAMQDERSE